MKNDLSKVANISFIGFAMRPHALLEDYVHSEWQPHCHSTDPTMNVSAPPSKTPLNRTRRSKLKFCSTNHKLYIMG
jgi:hypothetical protein